MWIRCAAPRCGPAPTPQPTDDTIDMMTLGTDDHAKRSQLLTAAQKPTLRGPNRERKDLKECSGLRKAWQPLAPLGPVSRGGSRRHCTLPQLAGALADTLME